MYYLVFGLLYLISLIPLKILYFFSDLGFIIIYHLFGYRKKIVTENLSKAFPEKSDEEISKIQKSFYRSFCDQWIETIKLMSMPLQQMEKRLTGNWEIFNEAAENGNGRLIVLLGHFFNWEWWNVSTPLRFQYQYAGMYLPISSKIVDRLFLYIRNRSNTLMIPANRLLQSFHQIENTKHILAFIADQNPGSLKVADWQIFMNRPAPFLNGPEKIARKKESAVIWVGIEKIKRGYYKMNAEIFCANAAQLQQGDIVKGYVSFMEKQIKKQPENWMWTHRRWKIKAPEDFVKK